MRPPPTAPAHLPTRAPQVVLDTNVLLDCWVFADPAALPLWQALRAGRMLAWRCAATDGELGDVLARPQFNLRPTRQSELLAEWKSLARELQRVLPAPWPCSDPHDLKFLDLAHSARASALITKDRALLKTGRRALRDGLMVLTPQQWQADGPPTRPLPRRPRP